MLSPINPLPESAGRDNLEILDYAVSELHRADSQGRSSPALPQSELLPSPQEETVVPPRSEFCSVCLESLPISAFPAGPPSKHCWHIPTLCSDCLRQYIDSRVGEFGAKIVPCPFHLCREVLEYEDMKIIATPQSLAKVEDSLLREYLRLQLDFVFCKNPHCDAGQFHLRSRRTWMEWLSGKATQCRSDSREVVKCYACGAKACFRDDVPWHEGLTCAQYRRSRPKTLRHVERESRRNVRATTRPCPKCRVPISKVGGCDQVRCPYPRGCGHVFRWSKTKRSSFAHLPDLMLIRWWSWWSRREDHRGQRL